MTTSGYIHFGPAKLIYKKQPEQLRQQYDCYYMPTIQEASQCIIV